MRPADPPGDGDGESSPETRAAAERRARRRRRLRAVMMVVGVVLTAANLWVCADREKMKEKAAEQHGLERYLSGSYRDLHKQTESVLSGLAGLVVETAPTAKGAVDILDHEIVPNLDWIYEQGRGIVPDGEAARLLHSEYLKAIVATRADAVTLRATFADGALAIREQRERARTVLIETGKRYQTFNQHVVEAGARTGLLITPQLDAGVGKPKRR